MDTSSEKLGKYTLKKQRGGWYENTFNSFQEKAISENDKLKQTDKWWNDLKEELNFFANEMSDNFMAEPRFANMNMNQVQNKLDLINILGLHIAQHYATIILRPGPYNNNTRNNNIIEDLNKNSISLNDIVNIDFVEFIQVLIDFIKSSEYYGELNVISNYRQQDDFTTLGIRRLAKRIKDNIGWSTHYDLYTKSLMDSVKLLEIFLWNAYTGKYGELQNRDMVCDDYFFDSIENEEDIIDWVEEYDNNKLIIKKKEDEWADVYDKYNTYTGIGDEEISKKGDDYFNTIKDYQHTLEKMRIDIQKLKDEVRSVPLALEFDPNIYPELYDKETIKDIWNLSIYDVLNDILNTRNTRNTYYLNYKENWKKKLKELKELHRFLAYSMLINRNDYDFFGDDKILINNFDKNIYKTYEQFQVKLVVFYKKLLSSWLGPFDSVEEYMNDIENDEYKNRNKLDFRFMDLIKCIELQINKITKYLHPRNRPDLDSDDSDDNKYVLTRHVHLYDPSLNIDVDEDSDDEFERIGNELLDHSKKMTSYDYETLWEYEERDDYLRKTFDEFKDQNQWGYPTYHLEYSKNKRGNPNLINLLEKRGLADRGQGHKYLYNSVEEMSDGIKSKVNMKELRNLKGVGLDLEKHEKNLFPERIEYLETVIEDDKEIESEKQPRFFEQWEERPDGWSSDDELAEEEFDIDMRKKHIEKIMDAKRKGKSRSLQRDWYKKHQLQNIEDDILEDNPVLQTESMERILRKSLQQKYGIRSFRQTPMQRINLSQQLRERGSDEGRELVSRIDAMERSRNIRSRQRADALDEELLQQSRLIDGRTPVQVMDLENLLRYRQNRRGVSENIIRNIDRERRIRDESTRRDRELFEQELL